ncbi:hypothetical protein BJY16_006322 [Actinoplanes octamycinicus]|uniref:Uncharacterized protein n=1 Tax=Actinoplanes octamycinicus TaxID=135948 RepID=A0A7W7MAA5_9ACTN|nr:hypothetical protein [Actinoplanes octamycinicus]MBB4742863.1 hypothetical protein [Actinoplanes octamycinicus]GIE58284.1 hypothetical protein Aoc01nite_36860 [Actinoplanes octamycinicus]
MSTRAIEIRDPSTGEITDRCQGPGPDGACPRTGRHGVVPCAGRLIGPRGADPRYWPIWVPPGCRQCRLNWNAQAATCLRAAERCHDQWEEGLAQEIAHVRTQAARGDPRFRDMSARQQRVTALWRWRLSSPAQGLRQAEQKQRDRSRLYLSLAEQQRAGTPPADSGPE